MSVSLSLCCVCVVCVCVCDPMLMLRRSMCCSRWGAARGRPSTRAASSAASSSGSIYSYPLGAEPKTLYEHPELYEAVFSYRDMKQEVRGQDAAWHAWSAWRDCMARLHEQIYSQHALACTHTHTNTHTHTHTHEHPHTQAHTHTCSRTRALHARQWFR
jgi:hypothetical protein